jgi:uncharacterized membrane protein YjjP (DUF1212 family)
VTSAMINDARLPERSADQLSDLLIELARAMHAVAVPTDTIEAMLVDVARKLGEPHLEVLVLQSALLLQLGDAEARRARLRRMDFDTHWRLAKTHDIMEVAHSLADGTLGVDEARSELRRIHAARPLYATWVVVAAYAVYSAAVAVRVGGGWLEMLAGALVGLVAGAIHLGGAHHVEVDLQQSFLAGLVGTLSVLVLALVLPPFGLPEALFGGVTLLVPAMVVTIGVHELASGALESGVLRLAYGFLRFAMLAAGIAAAGTAWSVFLRVPAHATAHGLPALPDLAVVAVGGLALVACLQARWGDAPVLVGAALLAHGTQMLTKLVVADRGAPLLTALVIGIAAQLYARKRGRLPAMVIVPALLQVAPGFIGTEAILHLLYDTGSSNQAFWRVLLVALQLVTGLLVAGILMRPRPKALAAPA